MKKLSRTLLISCAVLALLKSAPAAEAPVTRIVFGSCAGQDRPQPFWGPINELHPDLFLFLGDNIYADTVDPVMLRKLYGKLGEQPGYQQLIHSGTVLMATWDDHDYGYNDAGAEHPRKVDSQRVFLDFFQVPADSSRRKQLGVYNAQTFGPVGQRVQVILLDLRYFRSPLKRSREKHKEKVYVPVASPKATFMGATQWAWFKKQLREPAEIRLIGSSIQVIDDQHPYEKWNNIPRERRRLYQAIREAKAHGVIILSGDRHQAEISINRTTVVGYPLYDITASSLNKPYQKSDPEISLEVHDSSGTLRLQQTLTLSRLSPN